MAERDALETSWMAIWSQLVGRENVQPPLPLQPPPATPPPPPPPPAEPAPSVSMAGMTSSQFVRFISTILRQEVDSGEIIRKELDERKVTYDVIRREFVYRDDADGILSEVTIPCGEGCTRILTNRIIEVKMTRNCSKNLRFYFKPTDVSAFLELAAALEEVESRKRLRCDDGERPESVPSKVSKISFNVGPLAPQQLEKSRDESNTNRGFQNSTPKAALVPYRPAYPPQQFHKATVTNDKRRPDIPVAKPKPQKSKLESTCQSTTTSAVSSEFQSASSLQTKLQRDKLQSMELICSCRQTCAKKETKKCRCYNTGDIIHICMNCRYVVKLGERGQFQCYGKKCVDASQPAFLEELSGSSSLVFRCSTCGWSMKQVA